MKLKDFISKENPWEYNFEFEDSTIFKNFKPQEDIFKQYFTHRASALEFCSEGVYPEAEEFIKSVHDSGYLQDFDCDSSPLAKEIYSALWRNCEFGGDTMNSVHKRLAGLVQYFKTKNKAKLIGNIDSRKYLTQCYIGENHEAFIKKLKSIDGLEKYIDSYHTLGNFVLVPKGFNPYRASIFKDYWDSSLECLRVAQLKENSFNWYINYFFLWDYVEVNGSDYMEKTISPRNDKLEEYKNFFKETTDYIKRRGKFMTAMLMIQSQNPALYNNILTFLTDDNFTAKSISDTAKKILDEQPERKILENENATKLLVELEEGKV